MCVYVCERTGNGPRLGPDYLSLLIDLDFGDKQAELVLSWYLSSTELTSVYKNTGITSQAKTTASSTDLITRMRNALMV